MWSYGAGIITLANSKSAKAKPYNAQALNGMAIIHPSSLRKKASVQEKEGQQSRVISARVEIGHGYESF